MSQFTARFKGPGQEASGFASTAVTGGRFVKQVGRNDAQNVVSIAPAGLGDRVWGAAQHSSLATTYDERAQGRLVNCAKSGAVARVTAGANIAAGDEVISDALGRAVPKGTTTVNKLLTGVVADNNAMTFTAKNGYGDDVRIQLRDPAGNSQALSVDVDGNDIIVNLATSAGGAITSTPTTIAAAILEHDTASQMVTTANTGASTGAAAVTAVALTNLAGAGDNYVAGIAETTTTSGNIAEIKLA